MTGPLAGTRVVELAGMGPGPHATTLLADLGAQVVRVARPARSPGTPDPAATRVDALDPLRGSRRQIEADLTDPGQRAAVLDLIAHADVLVEGFRPGVAERLGLGPEVCSARNPALVYARMTGWGQSGPMADRAGHDINYLALTGILGAVGRAGEPPVVPLNLVGDFGGGSTYLVIGILAALLERARSGHGQVVDAAIVDGASHLALAVWGLRARGRWSDQRGTNRLDSGAPFYDVYATADGEHMAVGAIEPQFYAQLLAGLGLDPGVLPPQNDPASWPVLRKAFTEAFARRTRAEWEDAFKGTDACVTPVLSFAEAAAHPHLAARRTLVETAGHAMPGPAPRFSRTDTGRAPRPGPVPTTVADVLRQWAPVQPEPSTPRGTSPR